MLQACAHPGEEGDFGPGTQVQTDNEVQACATTHTGLSAPLSAFNGAPCTSQALLPAACPGTGLGSNACTLRCMHA
jgi:hypothetical protein